MEDLMFSLFLFVLIYSFLYRLTFGSKQHSSVLKIKQTVNRKSQSKAWLLKQIEKKLKANPIEVAPIIVEKVNAA